MAFKRSAVRSRLSPPQKRHGKHGFSMPLLFLKSEAAAKISSALACFRGAWRLMAGLSPKPGKRQMLGMCRETIHPHKRMAAGEDSGASSFGFPVPSNAGTAGRRRGICNLKARGPEAVCFRAPLCGRAYGLPCPFICGGCAA